MIFLLFMVVSCYFTVCVSDNLENQNLSTGLFWHISDTHVDENYSRNGNPRNLCHKDNDKFYPDNGLFGNFLCDSPQLLVNVTFKAMKKIKSNPDFIIWTGDNLPHTNDFDPEWDVIFETLRNATLLFEEYFPGIPFYPCIGNHDTFPPNILIPKESTKSIYEDILNKGGWNKFLNLQSISTFIKGGFYSQLIEPGLRIISLNTILWYTPNTYTDKMIDPLNQFKWLANVLRDCVKSSEMVYIIGHVPPGFYNRVKNGEKSIPTYHPQYLEAYLSILNKYSQIIKAQMFGHLHMDMFQIFESNSGSFLSSSILASSVSPWHFISVDNQSLPVNPSVRLIKFDHKDGILKDYYQFFLNLTKANTENSADKSTEFELLYTFTKAYNVPDVSTLSLVALYERLKSNNTLFEQFFYFSTAGKTSVTCDIHCKVAQLCSIGCTSIDEYNSCMEKSTSNVHHSTLFIYQDSSVFLTVGILFIVLCISVFLFIAYHKCKQCNRNFYFKL